MRSNTLMSFFISVVLGYLFAVNIIFLVSYMSLNNFLSIIIFFIIIGSVIFCFNILYKNMGSRESSVTSNFYRLSFIIFSGIFLLILM